MPGRRTSIRIFILGLIVLGWCLVAPAQALSFTVNSIGDGEDALPGDGLCETEFLNQECTLRAAIQEANAFIGPHAIDFESTIAGTLALNSALPVISQGLIITGPGADVLTIDAAGHDRIFTIGTTLGVTLSGLKLTGGQAPSGGAIEVRPGGNLSLIRSAVSGNRATNEGGGIFNDAGTVSLTQVTISANVVSDGPSQTTIRSNGGGIYNATGGTLTVTNSTISGNSADEDGGGIANNGTATLLNSTLSANVSDNDNDDRGDGGGIQNTGAANVSLKNTLIAGNIDKGEQAPDCVGNLTSQGHNLLGNSAGCTFSASSGDQLDPGSHPILASLADNGGPTQTHALLFGSPAIDAGTNIGCPSTDQRGVSRPIDGNGDSSAVCDIGAFEFPATTLRADLSVTVTAAPDPVFVGKTLTYTVVVTNNSTGTASNGWLRDTLPTGVTFVSATTTRGSCRESGGTVDCDLGTLARGADATITIKVTPTVSGVTTDTVDVTGSQHDPNSANNAAAIDTTVQSSADLRIAKTDSPDPVVLGNDLTYTITVTNSGPGSATGVTMTDPLPASMNFVFVASTSGSCSQSSSTVNCDLGTLAPGAAARITIKVTPTVTTPSAADAISNTATVAGDAFVVDPKISNNSASASTRVYDPTWADVSVTKTDSADPVVLGDNLTYTVTATNHGPAIATGVSTTDTLPGSVTLVSATSASGTCSGSGGTVTCAIGNLAVGGSDAITIVVTPMTASTVAISNTASVNASEFDPNGDNNAATEATHVYDPSWTELTVTKAGSPNPVGVANDLTYTVTVGNSGPGAATDVVLTDTLPANVTFVSVAPMQGSCITASGTVTCDLGDLATGLSASIIIHVMPTTTGTITNTAEVTGAQFDPDPANNATSVRTSVARFTTKGGDGRCFIATAVYGSSSEYKLRYLRALRDQYLLTNAAGRKFVELYYQYSPPIAAYLRHHEKVRAVVRLALEPLVLLSEHLVDDQTLSRQESMP